MTRFVSIEEVIQLIPDNCRLGIGGFCGVGAPDSIIRAIGRSYAETGSPKGLSIVTPACAGDMTMDGWGLAPLRADGLVTELYTSVLTLPKAIQKSVSEDKIACYCLPLGVFSAIFRAMAGHEPGALTHVGLGTFCDPRVEGCKINPSAKKSGKEVVQLVEINGEESLLYHALPMDVCIIRGSYADEDGNISIEKEAIHPETFAMATAVHNNGGIVIFQVEKIVKSGTLDPRMVVVHKTSVDYVVLSNPGEHLQNYCEPVFRPELCGDVRIPLNDIPPMKMTLRKVIARRALMELGKGNLVNLGLGISDGVALVANEEGVINDVNMSIETGMMGGVPQTGIAMGTAVNPEAIYSMPDTFDLYNGGGLDQSFLSGAQIDMHGNVNVSKFSGRIIGPGGFINISQNTPRICFSGIFTAGDPDEDGRLNIVRDGNGIKFVKQVEQITFSGEYARKTGQNVKYITERAVFQLTDDGLELIEIAPGVDLQEHILNKMEFTPKISPDLKLMDSRIFRDEKMGFQFSAE